MNSKHLNSMETILVKKCTMHFKGFNLNYKKAIIVGTDLPDISNQLIKKQFMN